VWTLVKGSSLLRWEWSSGPQGLEWLVPVVKVRSLSVIRSIIIVIHLEAPTMKKIATLFFVLASFAAHAQLLCVQCYDQVARVDSTGVDLILNGSFENTTCQSYDLVWDVFCPASSQYSCDISDWTCTGGGSATYTLLYPPIYSTIPDGLKGAYLGSAFGSACPSGDLSCLVDSGCVVTGMQPGYPTNLPEYGGETGVSLEQVVTGLTVGGQYTLEFWTGGENFSDPGVFGLDIGFGYTYLRCLPTPPGSTGRRYVVNFIADSTAHTIKFTNWGHLTSSASEVIIDDVRMTVAHGLEPCDPTAITDRLGSVTVQVYPTAFSDVLNVQDNSGVQQNITLFNMLGAVVKRTTFFGSASLDVQDLAKGGYVYEVRSANSSVSRGKVVKE
jgi:Secretion system C-terminal sorting domain